MDILSYILGRKSAGGGSGGGGGIDIGDYIDIDTTGMNIVFEQKNIVMTGSDAINTGVKLFSAENIGRDFKIVLRDLQPVFANLGVNESSFISDKDPLSPWQGLVGRTENSPIIVNNNGNIKVLSGCHLEAMVIERKSGVFNVSVFACGLAAQTLTFTGTSQTNKSETWWGVSVNKNMDVVTDVDCLIGGEWTEDYSGYRRFCKGTIGSCVIALGD